MTEYTDHIEDRIEVAVPELELKKILETPVVTSSRENLHEVTRTSDDMYVVLAKDAPNVQLFDAKGTTIAGLETRNLVAKKNFSLGARLAAAGINPKDYEKFKLDTKGGYGNYNLILSEKQRASHGSHEIRPQNKKEIRIEYELASFLMRVAGTELRDLEGFLEYADDRAVIDIPAKGTVVETPDGIRIFQGGDYCIVIQNKKNGKNLPIRNWEVENVTENAEGDRVKPHLPKELTVSNIGGIDLPGNYILKNFSGKVTIEKSGEEAFTDNIRAHNDSCVVDGNTLYYCATQKPEEMYALDLSNPDPKTWQQKSKKLPRQFRTVNELKLDPSGRFFIVMDGDERVVLHKDTLEEIRHFPQGPIFFDRDQNIMTADDEGRMVVYKTNLADIDSAIKVRDAVAEIMQTRDREITHVERIASATKSKRHLDPLKDKCRKDSESDLAKATDVEDFDKILKTLNDLRVRLRKKHIGEDDIAYITGEVADEINRKRADAVKQAVETIKKGFRGRVVDVKVMPMEQIEGLLAETLEAIKKTEAFGVKDTQLLRLRDHLEGNLKEKWQEKRDEAMAELRGQVAEVRMEIAGLDDLASAQRYKDSSILWNQLMTRFERYRSFIGAEAVIDAKKRLNDELDVKKNELKRAEDAKRLQIQHEHEAHVAEVETEIGNIDKEIQDRVANPLQLEQYLAHSGELTRVRKNIEGFEQDDVRRRLSALLEHVITKHTTRVQNADVVRTSADGSYVTFGAERFPKFKGSKEKKTVTWEINYDVRSDPSGTMLKDIFVIYFISPTTGEKKYLSEIEGEVKTALGISGRLPTSLSRRDFNELEGKAESYLIHIKKYLEEQSSLRHSSGKVPEIPMELIFSQEVMEYLEKMAKLSKMQLGHNRDGIQTKNPQGMLLLEGDTGTGKDILIDIFAAETNRPLFVFDCSKWTNKGDFNFTYEFEGRTVRVDSEVRKALATPGAILYFNEFNQLDQTTQKYLNSLLSHRREMGGQKAEDDVLIFASMNGRKGYHGVDVEASAVSRVRYLEVDYMRERATEWACSPEVIAQARKFPSLKTLSEGDLKLLWNHVINKQGGDLVKPQFVTLETSERISALSLIKSSLEAQGKLVATQERWNHSESYAMAKLTGALRSVQENEFKKLWDDVVNNPGTPSLANEKQQKLIKAFKLVVQVSNDIRRQFRKTHSGEDVNEGEEVRFIASLREVIECAKEIDYYHDLFEGGEDLAVYALRNVINPKIPRPEEKTYMETLFHQGIKGPLPRAA